MKTRRATIDLTWNGAAVTTKLKDFLLSATYTDPACGEADSLELSLRNNGLQWSTAWKPQKGDSLYGEIHLEHWDKEGDSRTLPLGQFILDSYSFSGFPQTATIQGVSTPADGGFAGTKRDKVWEQVTVEEIGKEIASRAGICFIWDVEAVPLVLISVEQSQQTDAEFYQSVCEDYGYAFKVYAQKMVVYDREEYKKRDSVGTISVEELQDYSWTTSLAGTYTGGQYSYTDPYTEQTITATLGGGTRLLVVSGEASSQADAQRKLQAAMDEANHSATTASITIMGNAKLVASQCIDLVGLGLLSGKYFIDSITHTIGSGYTMGLELSLVDNMTDAALQDAVTRLSLVGVMASPDYWLIHAKDLPYLDGLILSLSAIIRTNQGGSSVTTLSEALSVLAAKGAINSPDYWSANASAVPWLDTLLISAANALTP